MERSQKGDQERLERVARDLASALHGNLPRDTRGQVRPRYDYQDRPVTELLHGAFVREPVLGLVAVTAVVRRPSFVQITWRDGGPCTAVGRYDRSRWLPVRGPAPADGQLVAEGIDWARYQRTPLAGWTARLIAAHLHGGPDSELYRFAVNGALSDEFFDELAATANRREPLRTWAHALAQYCWNRADGGPAPGWALVPDDPGDWPDLQPNPGPPSRQRTGAVPRAGPGPLERKYVRPEVARSLMETAFALGVTAAHSPDLAMAMRRHLTESAATASTAEADESVVSQALYAAHRWLRGQPGSPGPPPAPGSTNSPAT